MADITLNVAKGVTVSFSDDRPINVAINAAIDRYSRQIRSYHSEAVASLCDCKGKCKVCTC